MTLSSDIYVSSSMLQILFLCWTLGSCALLYKLQKREWAFPQTGEKIRSVTTSLQLLLSLFVFIFLFIFIATRFPYRDLFSPLVFHSIVSYVTWIAYILVYKILPINVQSLIFGKKVSVSSFLHQYKKGVIVALCLYPLLMIFHALLSYCIVTLTGLPWKPQSAFLLLESGIHHGWLFWFSAVSIIFCVPCIEEILFRGFFQKFLSSLIHPTLAIALSAALFASVHYTSEQEVSNYSIIGTLFLFGIIASLVQKRYGDSLVAAIGFHSGFNGVSLLLMWTQLV